LYDEKASTESIQVQAQAIHDKYYQGFDALYNKLITVGKVFAQQHNITVHWAD
jgi:CRISPR/Cas system-associated protein Csm6